MHGLFPTDGSSEFRALREDVDPSRIIDVIISLGLLLFTAPLLLLVAVMIRLQDGGPVLFEHARVGRRGRTFGCLKFRSMAVDAEARLSALFAESPQIRREWEIDHKLQDDPRVTRIGRFLRKSSLDELPQLWNILRGDMSLVGPRPITPAETFRYGRYLNHYCRVRPGLTGLWQVSGRNDVPYGRRVAMDVYYARSRSLGGDLMILLRTVPAVLLAKGSS